MDFNPTEQQPELLVERASATCCPSCEETFLEEVSYCESCGYPIKGNLWDQENFITNRDYRQLELNDLNAKIKKASTTLFVLSAIFILTGIFFYATSTKAVNPLALFIVFVVVAFIYVGLALWSKRQPLPAIVSGLVLFVILQLVSIIQNPSFLFHGIIMKVLVIGYLIKGVRSASDARQIKRELNLR